MFFEKMINLQLTLLLLIAIGVYLRRKEIISGAGQKMLSDLMIDLILPCNIIQSFLSDITVSEKFIKNCCYAFGISCILEIISFYIGKYLFRKCDREQKKIFIYGMLVTNSSFIGIPIINVLYGSTGVLYTSLFQIPVRLVMWTSGLSLFTNIDRKTAIKKSILHPCVLSIGIGSLLMLLNIELPVFLNNVLTNISNCIIPVSMLIIGAMISECKILQLVNKSILYYCMIRLIIFPLLISLVLGMCKLDTTLIHVIVLLSAMPMAGTTAILAEKYNGDSKLAAQTIFVSTLLSVITLSLIVFCFSSEYFL